MAKQSNDQSSVSRVGRLLGAVETARRVDRPDASVESRPTPARVTPVTAKDARKAAPRAIKFPNATSALRQHVTSVQERQVTAPPARIRVRTPPAAASERVTGPSPDLRERAVEARRATAVATGMAVGHGALAAAVGLGIMSPPIEVPSDIARLVRERRDQLGLTQAQLANLAGTGRRFISELESGKPTLELGRVLAVCRAVGIRLLAELQRHER